MTRLTVTTFVTLDGVMQAPGGPEEDTAGGFGHGGWVAPFFDEASGHSMEARIGAADAFLLGRRTYDIFAAYWPLHPDFGPIARALNTKPKYVASRSLEKADWENSTVLRGDAADTVRELKARGGIGELQVHGSGDLVHTLARHDLVDEYRLLVFPVLLGSGKRLFAEGAAPVSFELTAYETTESGVAVQTYERVGKPEYGTVGE